jgi:uncharacterized protein (DUF427 family)
MTPAHGFSSLFRRPQPIKAKAGQESVWDYPLPPRAEQRSERIIVRLGGQAIADTTDALRVLETSHPPVYYLPLASVPAGVLGPVEHTSFCELKGEAHYFDVVAGGVAGPRAGWTYPKPTPGFEALSTRVALYPGHMVGPFKGGPGTAGW